MPIFDNNKQICRFSEHPWQNEKSDNFEKLIYYIINP